MNKSIDYHDYVFREGMLEAEYEEMYRSSATIPLHQDEQEHWIDMWLTKEILLDIGRFDEIHNFGCDTGHYLDLMVKHSLATNGKSYGYDVSVTASKNAASLLPHGSFSVLDLTQRTTDNEKQKAYAAFHYPSHILICVSETGHHDRQYTQSNAVLRMTSCLAELSAVK